MRVRRVFGLRTRGTLVGSAAEQLLAASPHAPHQSLTQPRDHAAPARRRAPVLEYDYNGVQGGIDDQTALGFATRSARVVGLTFEKAKAGVLKPELEIAFEEAVDSLRKHGDLIGISGNCGSMMYYQNLVRKLAKGTPCFMSPLMQAQLISSALPPKGQILVLTADKGSLTAARQVLLTEAGVRVDDPVQFVIDGLQDLPGFEVVADPSKGAMNKPLVERGILELVRTRLKRSTSADPPRVHRAAGVRRRHGKATSLPVFDVVTCLNFFHGAYNTSFRSAVLEQQKSVERAADAAGAVACCRRRQPQQVPRGRARSAHGSRSRSTR